jgi:TolB-like protein
MKVICINVLLIFLSINGFAQTSKVAILDFENTSGKTEYDALGKAMSSMLITDLSNNIHPKKVEFFERSQLNKLLDEQKLQKSKNFDAKTAVDFGKLSGVNYVLVGSVFVMDGNCNITSQLVDVQTSKIVLSKEANGKIEAWLQLKSQLAESIAQQLNNPITLDPSYKDQATTLVSINQYGKVLSTMDQGDADKAEQMRSLFEETNPDFKYFTDLKDDIEQLKKRISELESVTEVLTDAFELGDKAEMKQDYPNAIKFFEKFLANPGNLGYIENKKLYAYTKLAFSQFKTGDYQNALVNSKNAQKIYTYFPEANQIELLALIKLNENQKAEDKYNFIIDSLIFTNELNTRRKEYNPSLIWESIDGVYFGMRPQENSEAWIYLGISNNGYGSSVENEVQIKKILNQNSLTLPQSKNQLSQYEKIESKLLAFNDSLIFSNNQILNFYKLSLTYADELYRAGNIEKYKLHIEKEIKRIESFGVNCDDSKRDLKRECECFKHFEIVRAKSNLARAEGAAFNKISTDKYAEVFSKLDLSNSFMEFENNYPLIYGEFIFKYLIILIKENSSAEGNNLYKKIIKEYVTDRDSYFYGYYWDIILGLRELNKEFNSRFPLTKKDFEIKLDEKIKKTLKKNNIPIDYFNKMKTINSATNEDIKIVEVDPNFVSENVIWSKNICITEDSKGNKFKYAENKDDLYEFFDDSIPAYCYYDFDQSNEQRYGKLYNFYAMKLLISNPPKNWFLPNTSNYELLNNINFTYHGGFFAGYRWKEDLPYLLHGMNFQEIDNFSLLWLNENPIETGHIIQLISNNEMHPTILNCNSCCFSIRLIKK